MKRSLKQTTAILLAATMLIGNSGVDSSTVTGTVREYISKETVLTAKAATKKTSTANTKAKTKKQKEIEAYNKKAKKAYMQFLKGYFEKGKAFTYDKSKYTWGRDFKEYGGGRYLIYDLNNDGKKELILDTDMTECSSNPYTLFIYYKGKVKCIGRSGQFGEYWRHKKGKLIGHSYNDIWGGAKISEGYKTAYYRIVNGKLKMVAHSFDNEGWAGDSVVYWIGKKRVSKKKYEDFLKKNTGSKNPKAISIGDKKFVQYK